MNERRRSGKLLLTDEFAMKESGRKLQEQAYRNGVETLVVSTHHDGGETLSKLGGAGVLLRYRVED